MSFFDLVNSVQPEVVDLQRQHESGSVLSRFFSQATEFLHGANGSVDKLSTLSKKVDVLRAAGANEAAAQVVQEIEGALASSRGAVAEEHKFSTYGTNFAKAAALFFPGNAGRAASGVVHALDGVRYGDTLGENFVGFGLGLGKGVALKSAVDHIGAMKINNTVKAVLTGASFRFVETGFKLNTWLDEKTGAVTPLHGLGRTLFSAADPGMLATDVVVFSAAHWAMGKTVSADTLRNPMVANGINGMFFGLSSGYFQERARSQEQQTPFDPLRVGVQGLLDGLAALPGGYRMRQMQLAEVASLGKSSTSPELSMTSELCTDATLALRPRALTTGIALAAEPGSPLQSREFVIVRGGVALQDWLSGSQSGGVRVEVQEAGRGGTSQFGRSFSLGIQHLEPGRPFLQETGLADLYATCNPAMLGSLRGRHVLPDAPGGVVMEVLPTRLRFFPEGQKTTAGALAVRLGGIPVSELLLQIRNPRFYDLHPITEYARLMYGYGVPARRLAGGGADALAIELVTGDIMKITHKPVDPSWGERTAPTRDGGVWRFDVPRKSDYHTLQGDYHIVTWYLQQKATMDVVSRSSVVAFRKFVEHSGDYKFWDVDLSSHGISQIGAIASKRGPRLALVDYDAVRTPDTVPDFHQPGNTYRYTPFDFLDRR